MGDKTNTHIQTCSINTLSKETTWKTKEWIGYYDVDVDWIHLAQDGNQWKALVNVIIFTFHKILGI
jgi:hypothetical protein